MLTVTALLATRVILAGSSLTVNDGAMSSPALVGEREARVIPYSVFMTSRPS